MSSKPTSGKPKLIWLLFIHRHGDRAPLNMAPKDKYNDVKYWPEGFGNLNNAGRMRMYKVGKFIRRRYDGFLSDNFRESYSRSSDVERCIESSNAVLAGLYPPSDRFKWNKDIPWTPAHVHSCPAPDDYMLNESGTKYIADVAKEIISLKETDVVKELYKASAADRELLEKEMGYEYDMLYKFTGTYSTFDIEERNGYPVPEWYTMDLRKRFYNYAGLAFKLAGAGTEKLKRMRCGHLLDDIIKRMKLANVSGPKQMTRSQYTAPTNAPAEVNERKVVHYSTHDSILAALLTTLNINDPPIPPAFGATLFIELYIDVDDNNQAISDKYLRILYMDDTESENPIEKKLPNCKLDAHGRLTLDNFIDYVKFLLPTQT